MKNNSVFPVLVSLLVSFAIALFAYFLLIHCVVDTDLHTSHREIALLDFYQHPHTNDIFILGSSYVTEGIDGYLVEDALREKGINRSVYNLGIQAETPLSRLPELKNLIASKPGMVVIGLGYRDLANRTDIYDDRFALISQRVQLDESYRPFSMIPGYNSLPSLLLKTCCINENSSADQQPTLSRMAYSKSLCQAGKRCMKQISRIPGC